MRKALVMSLIIVLLVLLVGCGSQSSNTISENPPSKNTSTTSNETQVKETKILAEQDYIKLYTDADKFAGYTVDLFLKVFIVEKDDKGTYIQGYYDPEGISKNTDD